MIFLRAPDNADRPGAIVEGSGELAVVAGRCVVARKGQGIASGQLAAIEAADAGPRIGRETAHEGGQREATGDRKICGAGPLDHAEPQSLAALQQMAAVGLDWLGWRIGAVDQGR